MVGPLRQELLQLGITHTRNSSSNAANNGSREMSSSHREQRQQQAAGQQGAHTQHVDHLASSGGQGAIRSAPLPSMDRMRSTLHPLSDTPQKQQQRELLNLTSSRNVYHRLSILDVATKPRPCVMVSVDLPGAHRAHRFRSHQERKAFWSQYGHGTLPSDSLVCVVCPGEPLVFATVVRRDVEELAEEQPVVGLGFEPGAQLDKLLQQMGKGPLENTALVQVSAFRLAGLMYGF